MAVSLLGRIAASAPAPAFVVAGRGGRRTAWRLATDPRVEVVASPRHATVLLVAGAVPADHAPALRQIHDQLPHPRGAVWSGGGPLADPARRVLPTAVETSDDPVGPVRELHAGLMRGERDSSPVLGPVENPTAWKGVGPHGQGGEGMMGGAPYGRPMAMTGPDVRDGLQLDRVALTVGPYHAALPAGLTLDLELQGDVIVGCEVNLAGGPWLGTPPDAGTPAGEPGSRLWWLAAGLELHGLPALARRVARGALEGRGPTDRLLARARRGLAPALRDVGAVDGRDALDRLEARLADAGARWRPPRRPVEVLAEQLPGMEWGEAVTTVWSLDPQPLAASAGVPT